MSRRQLHQDLGKPHHQGQETNEYYYVNYTTHAIYPNQAQSGSTTSPLTSVFGNMDFKSANTSERIMEFDV